MHSGRARTESCRAGQLADRSRATLNATRVPPDHKASRSASRPGSRSRRPRTTRGYRRRRRLARVPPCRGPGRRTPAVTERHGPPMRASQLEPPIWRRLGRLVFHAHAAPNMMFCRGGESPRAIKIPRPDARGRSRRCGRARPAAGQQAARLVAGPAETASARARPADGRASTSACTPARNSSRSAALTGNPPDGFPPER